MSKDLYGNRLQEFFGNEPRPLGRENDEPVAYSRDKIVQVLNNSIGDFPRGMRQECMWRCRTLGALIRMR